MTNFVEVTDGLELALGHRPKYKDLPKLKQEGVTHLVTLLSAREGGTEVQSAARYEGIGVVWMPLPKADVSTFDIEEFNLAIHYLSRVRGRMFVHCSAGIHRTGMVGYAILRNLGYTPEQAKATLAKLRPITANQVTEDRLSDVEGIIVT